MGDLLIKVPQGGIGEELLSAHTPLVRATVVSRLERLWASVEPYLDGSVRPDPRMLELGLRVCDRLCQVYRLSAPARELPEANSLSSDQLVAVVSARLRELSARSD